MVRITGNLATNAGVAICGGTAIYFPTSVNATESTSAGCGTADTTNSSGVFSCISLAANKYDIRVNCGSAFRWDRYADEIQHATFQTGDGCSSGTEGNVYFGIGTDAGLRWSTADSGNHAFVIASGASNQIIHLTSMTDIATDWCDSANAADTEVKVHSSTTPASDYLMLGRHTGTVATIDVQGGTTLNLDIAGATELTVTSAGLNVPANSNINFTGTTGTNDIVLTNALADALSITDGSADVMVFDTNTAGNVITITASLAVDGDIDFTGPQEITTTTGDLTLNPAASTNITLTDDDADALDAANSAASYYLISTINTTTGTTAHVLDTEDATIASATGATYRLMSLPTSTWTFTGSTQMTSLQETVSILGPTLATDSVGLTIDKATTLSLTAPIEGTAGGGTTLTATSAARILNTSGTPATQYGLFIEDLTAGATSDYGIWIAGADTAAIAIASADPLQLGVAGTATGTMNWQGASSGTVNMTVAATAGCWTLTLPVNNGTPCQVLTTNGCGVTSWASASAGAVARAGGSTTEATTTSTSATCLITVSSLCIAVTTPFQVFNLARKSCGASVSASGGLKLNSTVIAAPTTCANDANNMTATFSTTDEVQAGHYWSIVNPIVAGYTVARAVGIQSHGPATVFRALSRATTAARPNAITEAVILRSLSGNASVTIGQDEMHIYTFSST
jgi:hypothetical protein